MRLTQLSKALLRASEYFPSFGLYLTCMGPGLHGLPAENDLYYIMSATFAEPLAGCGHMHQSKLVVNERLVTPMGASLSWCECVMPNVQR